MKMLVAAIAFCLASLLPANASVLFSSTGTLGLVSGTSGPDFVDNVYFDATAKQFGFSYSDLSLKIYNEQVLQLMADASLLSGPPANPALPPGHAYELRLTLGEAPQSALINDRQMFGEMTYFNGHSAGGVDGFCCYTPNYVPWTFSGKTLVYRFSDQILYEGGASANFFFLGPVEGIVQLDNFAVNDPFTLTISSVPEPAAWAMMLLGFGGIGFMLRARARDSRPGKHIYIS